MPKFRFYSSVFLFSFFFFRNLICLNSCFAVAVFFRYLLINIFGNFVTLTAVFCYLLLINTFSLQLRHINRY